MDVVRSVATARPHLLMVVAVRSVVVNRAALAELKVETVRARRSSVFVTPALQCAIERGGDTGRWTMDAKVSNIGRSKEKEMIQ